MKSTRVDKWLWAIRIYKTRSLSNTMCKAGKIRINDKLAKPSSSVEEGMTVKVKKNGFNLQLVVNKVIDKRVSATLAAPCYNNITPESEMNKYKDWFIGKAQPEFREKGAGRPTKRERREIEEYKLMEFAEEYFEDVSEGDGTNE